jgi:hypothetical protein
MKRRRTYRAAHACAALTIALAASLATTLAPCAAVAAESPAAAAPSSQAAPWTAPPAADADATQSAPATAAPPAAPTDAAQAEDIRDIRGPKHIIPLWQLIALALAIVLLAAFGYFAYRWQRRQRQPRPLLPFEIALQNLEGTRGLMHPATVREFSIAISDIVRQYIEVELKVTATHRTTEEFLRDLLDPANTALAAHRGLLADFLNRCDMAKFAGMSLSQQIMESLYSSARSFVIETSKPAPSVDDRGLAISPQAGAA